jgi:hypothetical protein
VEENQTWTLKSTDPQAASNLKPVTNLNDSLQRFGYTKDDRIERRFGCDISDKIIRHEREEIHNLAHDSCYDSVKEMRTCLTNSENEYNSWQLIFKKRSTALFRKWTKPSFDRVKNTSQSREK